MDLEYGELGHNRDVDLGICGDAAAVLAQRTDAISAPNVAAEAWLQTLREAEEKAASQAAAGLNSDQVPIHPLRLCKEINDFLTEDTIFIGDGAFGLTGFDIDTAVRFDLPFVSVVGNNAGWNQIRYGQLAKYGMERGDVANKLSETRYDLIVEAMGGYGELVTQPEDIRVEGCTLRRGECMLQAM